MTMPQPALSRNAVRNIDRVAIENYHIPGIVLMENAGRNTAELLLRQSVAGPVVICCGKGNNGGDGFVIARHLDIHGCDVRVLLFADPNELEGDAKTNCDIVRTANLPLRVFSSPIDFDALDAELAAADWIVDALLGTGTRGEVREPFGEVIERINAAEKKVLAVDLPSGLDCDTGDPLGPCIQADLTATFVARKLGFNNPASRQFTGEVHVIDIGVPRVLLK